MFRNYFKKIALTTVLMALTGMLFAQGKKSVDTTVTTIDRHGNLNLEITNSKFAAKGFAASDMVNVKVGNFKFTAPIVKDYSDVDNGEYLVRINGEEVSIAINMGNLQEASGAEMGTPVNISLKEKQGYLITYQVRRLVKSDERDKYPSDEVFANFREVKMGSIGAGKLYRSSTPVEEDNPRSPYAAALLEKYNVTSVINLADSQTKYLSRENTPEYCGKLYDEGKIMFMSMSASYSSDEFPGELHDILLFIAENPGNSFCIHGKEGKIRTGYVCAVLEALCGASMEEIEKDYMITFENYYSLKRNKQQYENLQKTIPYLFQHMNGGSKANPKKIQQITQKFLKTKAGLTDEQLAQVVKNLQ